MQLDIRAETKTKDNVFVMVSRAGQPINQPTSQPALSALCPSVSDNDSHDQPIDQPVNPQLAMCVLTTPHRPFMYECRCTSAYSTKSSARKCSTPSTASPTRRSRLVYVFLQVGPSAHSP